MTTCDCCGESFEQDFMVICNYCPECAGRFVLGEHCSHDDNPAASFKDDDK